MRHVREWFAVVLATSSAGVVAGAAVALVAELLADPLAALSMNCGFPPPANSSSSARAGRSPDG